MMLAKAIFLMSIAALLAWMLYFMLGSLPLLILKHDDASDSQLVRGFFNVHYLVLMSIASIGTLSAIIADRRFLAASIACIALIGFTARKLIVARMDQLRSTLSATNTPAIQKFRKLHITGLALNLCLLIGFVSALSLASAEIISCVEIPPGCRGDGCRAQCSLL